MEEILEFEICFEFHPEKLCDQCNNEGAYDFIGEFLCEECLNKELSEYLKNGRNV